MRNGNVENRGTRNWSAPRQEGGVALPGATSNPGAQRWWKMSGRAATAWIYATGNSSPVAGTPPPFSRLEVNQVTFIYSGSAFSTWNSATLDPGSLDLPAPVDPQAGHCGRGHLSLRLAVRTCQDRIGCWLGTWVAEGVEVRAVLDALMLHQEGPSGCIVRSTPCRLLGISIP